MSEDRRTNRQVLLDDLEEERCMRWPDTNATSPRRYLGEVIEAIYQLMLRDDERQEAERGRRH